MLSTAAPAKTSVPFGNGGSRNVIPVPSQISITPGAASFTDGFPPLTYTDPTAGGIAPAAQDFNGILYAVTLQQQWQEAGGLPSFDSTFATAIGGYPKGAALQSADMTGVWVSTADNNTANPDTGGAGWIPLAFYGSQAVTLAGTNVTLTSIQGAKPILLLTGTLTANVQLVLPATVSKWVIANNCAGNFTITAKTATGSGVVLGPGGNYVYGDGASIYSATASPRSVLAVMSVGTATAAAGTVGASGWRKNIDGTYTQWTTIQMIDSAATTSVVWTLPNAKIFANGVTGIRFANLSRLAGQTSTIAGSSSIIPGSGQISLASITGTPVTSLGLSGSSTQQLGTLYWMYVEVDGY